SLTLHEGQMDAVLTRTRQAIFRHLADITSETNHVRLSGKAAICWQFRPTNTRPKPDLFRKPVATQDPVRGRLFRNHFARNSLSARLNSPARSMLEMCPAPGRMTKREPASLS